jgi:hypothetical protein
MANISVRMEDGLLNIDEELEADIFQCPKMISEKLIMFLSEVLIPAIKSRVAGQVLFLEPFSNVLSGI